MNDSKIQPREFKVLILPEAVEERTAGGIILAQTTKEKEQMAQVKGTLVRPYLRAELQRQAVSKVERD